MGTASYDLSESGAFNKNVRGALVTSGEHTTSTTASNLTDGVAGGGSAIEAGVGMVLSITCDEPCRIVVGGGTATATYGYDLSADVREYIEISHPGTISIIDKA